MPLSRRADHRRPGRRTSGRHSRHTNHMFIIRSRSRHTSRRERFVGVADSRRRSAPVGGCRGADRLFSPERGGRHPSLLADLGQDLRQHGSAHCTSNGGLITAAVCLEPTTKGHLCHERTPAPAIVPAACGHIALRTLRLTALDTLLRIDTSLADALGFPPDRGGLLYAARPAQSR
jgi:hypothetical protein